MTNRGCFDLLRLLNAFYSDRQKYKRIKQGEKREKSVYFGIMTMVYSVLLLGFGALGALGVKLLSEYIIVAVFFLAAAIPAVLILFIKGTIAVIYQLTLNRKAIGIIALIVFLLSLAGTIILAYIIGITR